MRAWLAGLCALFCTQAQAIDIRIEFSQSQRPFIYVTGRLEQGDQSKFIDAVLPLTNGIVVLASEGGDLWAGLEIGRAIRLKRFATYVPNDVICASSCALAWLGGIPRAASDRSRIGFHAASNLEFAVSPEGNALIGSYLGSLGLSEAAIIYITRTAPTQMQWLNFQSAAEHGIDIRRVELPPPAPPQQSPLPPPQPPLQDPRTLPPAATTRAQLESDTRSFVLRHTAASEASEADIKQYITLHYADLIIRDDRQRRRSDIIDETVRYVRRWPARSYTLAPAPMRVACELSTQMCTVTYEVNWSIASPERRTRIIGSSRVELLILHGPYRPIIQRERGERLRTQTAPF